MVATGVQPQDQARRRDVIPDDVKQMVWLRDGGRCRQCGAQAELQFDHIIPVAMGGSSNPENLQILCGPCNRRKSAGLTIR
jgi:5-methylcytosine-specific restriction endonuclease McrA